MTPSCTTNSSVQFTINMAKRRRRIAKGQVKWLIIKEDRMKKCMNA